MRYSNNIRAGALPIVMVVSVLMLLGVLVVISLWESDSLFFSRHNRIRNIKAHINSMYVLYENTPELFLSDTTIYQLYDSVPDSKLTVIRSPFGLYNIVHIENQKYKLKQRRILGLRECSDDNSCFWYCDNNSVLTLTGNSNITATCHLPKNGVAYGQMKSAFFTGTKIEPKDIKRSKSDMPIPCAKAKKELEKIFSIQPIVGDTTILIDGEITITASDSLEDIIVIADKITIDDGFNGSVQCFARDSIFVGANVILKYPSGLYSQQYISIGDNSHVNGYVIVESREFSPKKSNYIQERSAKVRGLLFIDGVAQLQGIVTGTAYLREASYFSPQGYYRHMIYDATVLDCDEIAYPYFTQSEGYSRTMKQLK